MRQTLAFHRVLQHALHHAENAEKDEIEAGDLLAARFQEPDSHAVALLREQEVSRLDVLQYISHGISKLGSSNGEGYPQGGANGVGRTEGSPASDAGAKTAKLPPTPSRPSPPDSASRRARALDPLIGRHAELERTVHILARRRKNNPIFVGETGVGKTAIAEGLAQRIVEGEVPDVLEGAEIFSLDLGALLAGTRYRGDFEARFKALIAADRGARATRSSSSTRSTPSSAPARPRGAPSTRRTC